MRMGRCGNFPRMSDPAGRRILWVPAATSVTADTVFTERRPVTGRTSDPGGRAGSRRTAYAGQEALCKASSERGEVAGVSLGRKFARPRMGCGWTSGGRRRFVSAAAGAKEIPNTV